VSAVTFGNCGRPDVAFPSDLGLEEALIFFFTLADAVFDSMKIDRSKTADIPRYKMATG
jgi:hypothetical protein